MTDNDLFISDRLKRIESSETGAGVRAADGLPVAHRVKTKTLAQNERIRAATAKFTTSK